MVTTTIKIIALAIIIFIVLVLVLKLIKEVTGNDLAKLACKNVAGYFDPIIFTALGIRLSQNLCDVIVPEI